MTPHRRTEGGDRFSHNTVAVLEAFATSVIGLHRALDYMEEPGNQLSDYWADRAADWARSAVRAARLLTVRDEYR